MPDAVRVDEHDQAVFRDADLCDNELAATVTDCLT
jgi:hypothetical protein